jgi:hypothetical protein
MKRKESYDGAMLIDEEQADSTHPKRHQQITEDLMWRVGMGLHFSSPNQPF